MLPKATCDLLDGQTKHASTPRSAFDSRSDPKPMLCLAQAFLCQLTRTDFVNTEQGRSVPACCLCSFSKLSC